MNNNLRLTHWCMIRNNRVVIDDRVESITENFSNFAGFLKALYKKEQLNYPKFYKMDILSKTGILTAEKLLKESDVLERYGKEETGILLFNSSASLDSDIEYQKTIRDRSDYFPSPSVFVYTLPNILIGEICIRHKIKGENAFLVSEKFEPDLIVDQVSMLMEAGHVRACICGWVDVLGEDYESLLFLVEEAGSTRETDNDESEKSFTAQKLIHIYNKNRN
jgi:hypothetical protein